MNYNTLAQPLNSLDLTLIVLQLSNPALRAPKDAKTDPWDPFQGDSGSGLRLETQQQCASRSEGETSITYHDKCDILNIVLHNIIRVISLKFDDCPQIPSQNVVEVTKDSKFCNTKFGRQEDT